MKSNRKGNDLEKMVKAHLESEGWHVHRAVRTFIKLESGKMIARSNDIFGCFDIVALSTLNLPRFIQVTTKNGMYARRKKINKKFPKGVSMAVFEIWAWHGGKGRMYFARYTYDVIRQEWVREPINVVISEGEG